MMKVTITRLKKMALVLAGVLMAATLLVATAPARATDDDSAPTYKSKCAMCHGQTAEKKFDGTKADDLLIGIVLNGKQAEKPPNMPKFSEKGMTADQAKALVAYMKSLKQ